MERPEDFATVLRTFMEQARRGNRDLADLAGIPLGTLENWTMGEVRRPRSVHDLLSVARALGLDTAQTDVLLLAAGHPPLARLQDKPQGDARLRELLTSWSSGGLAEQPAGAAPMRHQLRPPVADFVGRTRESQQLASALRASARQGRASISALQGMGGSGKSELAYHVAHALRESFPDAQIVLDLRGTSRMPLPPAQALRAILTALAPAEQLPKDPDLRELQQRYRSALHQQRALILADDARDAAQVQPLIPPAGCALLITSRQRFTLPGMTALQLEQLDEDEASALLRAICPRLRSAEAAALARACGYLPLALRVSAGILYNDPARGVDAYLGQLADERQRLRSLRDPDDQQLDVAASLGLSYAQLDPSAQLVFRQLGVIVAGFSATLALEVVEAPPEVEVADSLHLLLRRNLLSYDPAHQRWRMHDLVRDLARGYLEQSGELAETCWRYAGAALRVAAEAEEGYVQGGEGALAALERFDAGRPHIDAARRWATQHAGTLAGDTLLIEEAKATYTIGGLRYDRRSERIPQLEQAWLAAQRLNDHDGEGRILNRLGIAYAELGEYRKAIPCFERSLELASSGQQRRDQALALLNLGTNLQLLEELGPALQHYEEALAIFQALGDQRGAGHTMGNLGSGYHFLGDIHRAIEYFQTALEIARQIGHRYNEGNTLGNLGQAYTDLGHGQRALPYNQQALEIFQDLGNLRGQAEVLDNLGMTYTSMADYPRAQNHFEQALGIAREIGDQSSEATTLANLAELAIEQDQAEQAIELCRKALRLLDDVGDRRKQGRTLCSFARSYAQQGQLAIALSTFDQAHAILHEVGDRDGAARCAWHYGLTLLQQGAHARALPLLQASLDYQLWIGHSCSAERAELLKRLQEQADTG